MVWESVRGMADVIICLGHKLTKRTEKISILRVVRAVELYKTGRARKILFTGGRRRRTREAESHFMARLAVQMGVPAKAILIEDKSTSTLGNAHFCLYILREHHWTDAILVTDPFHMPRALFVFESTIEGVHFTGEPSEAHVKGVKALLKRFREWQYLLVDRMRGVRSKL